MMMDTSNPLFSQVAIFARCLEERQQRQEQTQRQVADQKDEALARRQGVLGRQQRTQEVKLPTPEKRTTRRMQRQMDNAKQTESGQQPKEQVVAPKKPAVDEEKLYLVDPDHRAPIQIPDKVLDQIADKAITRSKRLAKQARKNIEKELNNVLFQQLNKLEMKFEYLRKFWTLFEQEKMDVQMAREECLAERVALSALKSSNTNAMPSEMERNLWQNQFSQGNQLLEQINPPK